MLEYGNGDAIEKLGARILEECVVEGKSIINGKQLWNSENFSGMRARYVENPDYSNDSFDKKLQKQLDGMTSDERQLAGELYILDLLVLGNLKPQTKVSKINAVLERCEPPLELPKELVDVLEGGGVLNGGQGYNSTRHRQFAYLILWGEALASKSIEQRRELASSVEGVEELVYGLVLDGDTEPQIQRALAYLFAPSSFVPITSGGVIGRINDYFGEVLNEDEKSGLRPERLVGLILDRIRKERGPDWDFFLDAEEWKKKPKRRQGEPVRSQDTSDGEDQSSIAGDVEEPFRGLPQFPDGSDRDLLVDRSWLEEVRTLLEHRKQIIFHGPPGTGKTYLARRIAKKLGGKAVSLVQFHPAYSYEDFFEGFRPAKAGDGAIQLDLVYGPLRRLAEQAAENPEQPHFLVVDEINRGNLARIFGELYFLLEYRDTRVELMYSHEEFSLPENLYIIGTMNTADRSIAMVDGAMRRRFAFVELHPDELPTSDLLRRWCAEEGRANRVDSNVVALWQELNQRISEKPGGRDRMIGPSYFMRDNIYSKGGLERVWRTEVLPLLDEMFFGERDNVRSQFSLESIRNEVDSRTGPQGTNVT
ncbi:McrB family protein [uncultured Corynebacterium sp.]|uniref:McrB family protein n=1 Tax=uncultured Corynebacterium sp. TaxID=159447 RepID=UPI0025D522E7|nr:AAA family ATPase [uncultured Corynebacterium sp.]